MIETSLKGPLAGMFFWLAGATLWNIVGVVLIASGQRSPGPTASLTMAAVLVVVGFLLFVLAMRDYRYVFAGFAALCAISALMPVIQAITGEPELWPSPLWRWAGAALNLIGVLASAWGAITALTKRRV